MNIFKAIAEKFSIPLPWGVFKNSAFTNYALDYQTFLQEAYNNPFIYKALNEIITDAKTVKVGVFRDNKGKMEYVENHKINKWLAKPNMELNGKDMIEYYILYLYLGGGCLLYKTKGIMEKQIYIYSPDSFDIQRDDFFNISQVKVGNTYIPKEDWNSFKVCKAVNVEDKIAGKSQEFRPILKSLALVGDMSNLAMIHQNRQLKNFGKRSGIISYKGVMTPDKKEEMKKTVKAMGTGEDTGGLAFLPADTIDYKATDQTSVEMDWLNSLQYMEEIISYSMGVPVQLISSRSSTYNNMAEAKKKIYIDTIIPLIQDYCEDLTAFFSEDLQEGFKIWYDTSEIQELKDDVMTVAKGVREALKGVATVNEIRDTLTKKTGIELKSISKELGDKVLVTSSDMFLDDLNVELEPLPKENEEESTKE